MRIVAFLKVALLGLMLGGCVAPLLVSPASQLMWALLKPMVGIDPNEANLFEQPLVKDRMTAILGPHYDTTVTLLKTASELQQEGPLFYALSRTAPGLSDKAGLVWNSDTNQMAVMLVDPAGAKVFAEQGQQPSWPDAMQGWQSLPVAGAVAQGAAATTAVGSAISAVSNPMQAASQLAQGSTQAVVNNAKASASQTVSKAATQASSNLTGQASAALTEAKATTSQATAAGNKVAAKANELEQQAATAQASAIERAPAKAASAAQGTLDEARSAAEAALGQLLN